MKHNVNGTHSAKYNINKCSDIGPIHTMRHVSVPSPFHLRSLILVCVHTIRRVQSPPRPTRYKRPAIISIRYAVPFVF